MCGVLLYTKSRKKFFKKEICLGNLPVNDKNETILQEC